ncbi:MAG: hypothetical protein RLZZ350_2356 [Verrucomicrobiota bacterium]|jgi:LmbE family N-acetylglucosaminyl deacetylase
MNFTALFHHGQTLPLGQNFSRPQPKLKPNAPVALVFSPHPDDECIIGGLALRLRREAGYRVVNIPVTLGSKVARRQTRLTELTRACDALGFELEQLAPGGLERITLTTRAENPAHWQTAVRATAALLWRHQPKIIFFPHVADGHPTHIGTHWLVMDALVTLPASFRCTFAETEFWGQMATPNLLVESSVADVTQLVGALALHVGEVRRNPYHLRLPAWLMDNVRRGAELVGERGGKSPEFVFGTLYRVSSWANGNVADCKIHQPILSQAETPKLPR